MAFVDDDDRRNAQMVRPLCGECIRVRVSCLSFSEARVGLWHFLTWVVACRHNFNIPSCVQARLDALEDGLDEDALAVDDDDDEFEMEDEMEVVVTGVCMQHVVWPD
jgi:hypothetical protein